MPWWGWMAIGALLLAAELGLSADFWLAVVGAAALGTSLLGLFGIDAPIWVQWLVFAGLAVFLAVFVRGPAYERLMAKTEDMAPELVGERGIVVGEAIAPGGTGTVSLRGSTWRARNEGNQALEEGTEAQVDGVKGVMLRVRAIQA